MRRADSFERWLRWLTTAGFLICGLLTEGIWTATALAVGAYVFCTALFWVRGLRDQ